jgi:hypothetical protein
MISNKLEVDLKSLHVPRAILKILLVVGQRINLLELSEQIYALLSSVLACLRSVTDSHSQRCPGGATPG